MDNHEMDEFDIAAYICIIVVYVVMSRAASILDTIPKHILDNHRRLILYRLYSESDVHCHDMLRMNRTSFRRLCSRLEEKGLVETRWVGVKEQVAMFLLVIGHDTRMRPSSINLVRSLDTIHRSFHRVLRAVLKLGKDYLKQANESYSPERSGDPKPWAMKYFKDCVGAIDGTFLPAMVPMEDQPRYRNRKGDLAHNVLAACSFDMKFTYVLAGWEGSAHDSRMLRAAVSHPRDKLIIPENKYYLGDAGFPLVPGILTPYRGTRYHLNDQRGNPPRTPKELFNYKHSSLRNVIERTFGLLKKRFAYLRKTPWYNLDTQVDLIIACCILHNFIRSEDPNDVCNIFTDPVEGDNHDTNSQPRDVSMRPSNDWTASRDMMANLMWSDYMTRPF